MIAFSKYMLKKVPLIPSPCGDPMFDGKGSDNLPFILMLIVVLLKSALHNLTSSSSKKVLIVSEPEGGQPC